MPYYDIGVYLEEQVLVYYPVLHIIPMSMFIQNAFITIELTKATIEVMHRYLSISISQMLLDGNQSQCP